MEATHAARPREHTRSASPPLVAAGAPADRWQRRRLGRLRRQRQQQQGRDEGDLGAQRRGLAGRAATASDFVKTWEAFKAKSQNAPGFTAVIDKVEAPDEKTVKITLKDVFAPFLTTHASSAEGIWFIPVETIDNGQVQKDPVGT